MARSQYTLGLFSPLLQGSGFLRDITVQAKGWERSIRLNGGCWLGSFTIEGTSQALLEWFNERMGCHIEERSGGFLTWSGMIYDMELTMGGITQWRSLDNMFNAIQCFYVGEDAATRSAWYTNDISIARYGRKELVAGETYVSAKNAEDVCQQHLAETAYPWARCTGISLEAAKTPRLRVGVMGYGYTINWRYLETTWDDEDDIDDTITIKEWFDDVLADATYLPFILATVVDANMLSVQKYAPLPVRIWDWAQNICKRGDGSTRLPWNMYVNPQRMLEVGPIDTTPAYYLEGGKLRYRSGQLVNKAPYLATPGVIRNMEWSNTSLEPGTVLDDMRDILVQEVSVTDGKLSLRTTEPSKEEVFAEQSLRWREEMMRYYSWLAQETAEEQRVMQEDWEKDYQKRKAAWDLQYPGVPFPG